MTEIYTSEDEEEMMQYYAYISDYKKPINVDINDLHAEKIPIQKNYRELLMY